MKNQFRVFAAVLGLAACFQTGILTSAAAEANMEKLAHQRYADNCLSCKRAKASFWAASLPGYTVYDVNVFNPASRLAGRETFLYLMLKTPDKTIVFIEKDQDAMAFLQPLAVSHRLTLPQIVEWFGHLRRVEILNEWTPGENPAEKEIGAPVYTEAGREQHAEVYVLADPAIESVVKYDFYLSTEFAVRMNSRWVSSRGGYD